MCDWLGEHSANINFFKKCIYISVDTNTHKIPFRSSNFEPVSVSDIRICFLLALPQQNTNLSEAIEYQYSITKNLQLSQT